MQKKGQQVMGESSPVAPVIEWNGCYDGNWHGLIVPDAFAHPAKFSYSLVCRIYQHLAERHGVGRGSVVVDPFGGVALGEIVGGYFGVRWFGCELEEKFVKLGNANIELHRPRLEVAGDPVPTLVQGDSRKLREVLCHQILMSRKKSSLGTASDAAESLTTTVDLSDARCAAKNSASAIAGSSPKDSKTSKKRSTRPESEGQAVSAVVSSPPYATGDSAGPESLGRRTDASAAAMVKANGWGTGGQISPGHVAALPAGDVAAVLSSPPYAVDALGHVRGKAGAEREATGKYKQGYTQGAIVADQYGTTPGQLGALPAGAVDGVIAACPKCGKLMVGIQQTREASAHTTELPSNRPGSATSHPAMLDTPLSGAACAEDASCRPVRTAEPKSDADPDGASPAPESMSARVSRVGRSRKGMGPKSPPHDSASRPRNAGGRHIRTGKAATIGGEAQDGPSGDVPPLNETDTNASGAAEHTFSKSTTKRTCTTPEASGTTLSITSKRSASHATERRRDDGSLESASAESATPSLRHPTQVCDCAQHHVGESLPLERNGGSTQSDPKTFWEAAALIVAECYAILRPGGVAVWVRKDFVRNKKRVPFSDDWRRLCEAAGFVTVEWIKASLVKEDAAPSLFGGNDVRRKERKSFFRRLAEKKGSPRIDHEDVLVMLKPEVGVRINL